MKQLKENKSQIGLEKYYRLSVESVVGFFFCE